MTPILVKVGYFARTAARGLRGSPVTTIVAVVTIGVSLVLVGAFQLLLRNMEEMLEDFGDDLYVTAYLADDLEDAEREELIRLIGTVEGVSDVRSVSKAEALERFRASVGQAVELIEGLDENPLPASLEIQLVPERRSPEGMQVVVESISGLPGIGDLASGQDWVEGYLRAIALVRGTGVGLSLVLALATLLIVTNTIRLAVLARRDELDILALVGASRVFMNTPFLIEGAVQGALGGAIALALLYGIFQLVLPGLEFGLEIVLGGSPRFFGPGEMVGVVAAGAALGVIGSGAAVAGSRRA